MQLLSQARLAARNGVSLDAVLRRYAAGHSLLADTLLEEAAVAGIAARDLKTALRALASRYDRVVAAIGEEYVREAEGLPHTSEQRRVQLLHRLLAGELIDTARLDYDFGAHHLGIVASGFGASEALRTLEEKLDRRLLLAQPDEQATWAWIGGRRGFETTELESLATFDWPGQAAFGCGGPAQGLAGWRLTHRQAAAALPIAQCGTQALVYHADVALLASVLQDDLLAASLRQAYLAPLEADRDGGAAAKDTLRAYFAAAGNVSSAAAALGLNRGTVSSRLAAIEERLGRSLQNAYAELKTALRLDEIEAS